MELVQLNVSNYKSLRRVSFEPGRLTVIAGPNGSGKSNLADCIDFVSEVYRHGLQLAVASKGGYENIAHRKMRRTKSPVRVFIRARLNSADIRLNARKAYRHIVVEHMFEFQARGSSIRAEYGVVAETLNVYDETPDERVLLLSLARKSDKLIVSNFISSKDRNADFGALEYFADNSQIISSTELITWTVGRFAPLIAAFGTAAGKMRVFQIHPNISRDDGVPGPRPELTRSGGNLPAVIDELKMRHNRAWGEVLSLMRVVMPGLIDIDVEYTPSRRLGLFFNEAGVGRPWSIGEVSDGTVQTLALLVALFDPQPSLLLIEEIENSVHSWIVRLLIKSAIEVSKSKQVVLTTHSAVVLNLVLPHQILIMSRTGGESALVALAKLDPSFVSDWKKGKTSTFAFLDSGILPEAVPPQLELPLN